MVTLRINGGFQELDVSPEMPLLWVLRDVLGMNGTKFGCGAALCGACTVHLDGNPRRSCVTPVSAVVGHAVTTIEAIGETDAGKKVQQAWLDRRPPRRRSHHRAHEGGSAGPLGLDAGRRPQHPAAVARGVRGCPGSVGGRGHAVPGRGLMSATGARSQSYGLANRGSCDAASHKLPSRAIVV